MTNEELNRYLAGFMGWVKVGDTYCIQPTKEHTPQWKIDIKDWNPTEDLNQAFQCLEKLKSEYDWQLMYEYAEQDDIWFSQEYSCDIWPLKLGNEMITGRSNTPALAICQALYKTMKE